MEQLVSVIIFGSSKKYLQRCINSLNRQSYKNIEIIKVIDEFSREEDGSDYDNKTNWYGINDAIANANGEYLVFANHTAVFSENTIEFLVSKKDEDILPVCKIVSQNFMLNYDQVLLGGLFERKYFTKEVIFDELCEYAELKVVYEYQKISKQKEQVYSCNCIYGEGVPVRQMTSRDLDIMNTLRNANVPNIEDDIKEIIRLILQSNSQYISKEQVLILATEYRDNSEISCLLAKMYVRNIYMEFVKNPTSVFFEFLEKYFSIYASDTDYLRLIYIQCGIFEEDGPLSYEVRNDSRHMELGLDEILVIANRLNGPCLADFFLNQVAHGKIGMKDLLKAIYLWIKFKLGDKKRDGISE